jgi:hypothetical protein
MYSDRNLASSSDGAELAWLELQPNSSPQVVHTPSEKITVGSECDAKYLVSGPQIGIVDPAGLEVRNSYGIANGDAKRTCGMRRRQAWILAAGAMIVAIVVAIGAGVGVAVSSKHQASSSQNASSNSTASPASSSPAVPPSQSGTPFQSDISNISTLAAVNWTEPSGAAQYRIYYQNRNNYITELSWTTGQPFWTPRLVTNDTIDVRNGSPLAAIVGWPGNDRTKPIVGSLGNNELSSSLNCSRSKLTSGIFLRKTQSANYGARRRPRLSGIGARPMPRGGVLTRNLHWRCRCSRHSSCGRA